MNAAHLHLVTNHAPLFGLVAALILLVWGVARGVGELRFAAYVAFILSAVAGGVAYFSGVAAESIVEDLPGMTEATIERHQDVATIALVLVALSGIGAIAAIFAERGREGLRRFVWIGLFVLAIAAGAVVGYTANLGGQIHHTEITGGKAQ